jgi:hypothetical protein
MKEFIADSNYHQFYVADRELEPDAPEDWTDDDVEKHHLTERHIVALSPVGDIDVRINSCGPDDPLPSFPDPIDFEVRTQIEIPSGKVGIYGWPWELEDQYDVPPGVCEILFRGYATARADEGADYYVVKINPKPMAHRGEAPHDVGSRSYLKRALRRMIAQASSTSAW